MRPRLLDLFCGAGGAARGYQLAGFHVTGVDIKWQPNYAGDEFIRANALEVLAELAAGATHFHDLDRRTLEISAAAIHASPPCQGYANVTLWRGSHDDHPQLIEPVRALLIESGLPWVMENVRTREIRGDLVLCGSMFDLPIRRHRHFETNWMGVPMVQPCQHRVGDLAFMHKGERAYANAMGCDWMTNREARQAIPTAYTEWIGERLMAAIAAPDAT